MPSLTLRQVLIITTRRSAPPWHAGELRTALNLKGPVSLSAVTSEVGAQRFVLFVQIRDTSILQSVSTLAELTAKWQSSHPGKDTVTKLSNLLAGSGAVVNFISNDAQTVGIAGTVSSLAGVVTILLASPPSPPSPGVLSGIANVAKGVAMLIGAGLALAGGPVTELTYWGLVTTATAGAAVTTVGIVQIVTDSNGQPPPSSSVTVPGQGNVTVVGTVPSGATTVTDLGDVESWVTDLGDVENWPAAIDLGDVETWPEFAGSAPPVPTPEGPGDDDDDDDAGDDDDDDEDADEDIDVE